MSAASESTPSRDALRADLRDDTGSSAIEFVLVGVLLTAVTLAVLQLALAVYVRNLVHDAAVEGAYHAALADVDVREGGEHASGLIDRTIGEGFVESATSREVGTRDAATIEVTIVTRLPLVGLLGVPGAWEVTAHAPRESFD